MKVLIISSLKRLFLVSMIWLVLTNAKWKEPLMAIGSLLGAVIVSFLLWPAAHWSINWKAVPVLLAHFLWNSCKGGIDVARRAFDPNLPMNPQFIAFDSRIQSETGKVLLAWMISLLPGTASVSFEKSGRLIIHSLDHLRYGLDDVRRLENRIASVLDSKSNS